MSNSETIKYMTLKAGELIAKGDEYETDIGWVPVQKWGMKAGAYTAYRRPIGIAVPSDISESNDVSQPLPPTLTHCSVEERIVYRMWTVAENAKEFAEEALRVLDATVGRTTRKNKLWAEHLEQSIVTAECAIRDIKVVLKDAVDYEGG
jgi:hypothetical protein